MIIKILTGDDARARLADADWRDSWTNLQKICPWATSMQSLPFVESWYDSYRETHAPVLVAAHNAENEIIALLTLAIESGTQRLVVAGDQMCEYGTWLAADTDAGNQFIVAALSALEKEFPNSVLQFLYLAAGTPLDWLGENKSWRDRCKLKKEFRPLLQFDDDTELQASLKKKGNRSRLNQMKKHGAVRLVQITDLSAFERIFNTVKSFGDLRLSAVHRVAPDVDANKKKFYLALFKANLLYVTLFKIGEEIASAHFDLQNGNSFLLGLTVLSPFFARYSPSKFHITLLCLELLKQNIHLYDLTPGGNYKDRHSNSGDEVHILTVYFKKRNYQLEIAKRRATATARNVLGLAKITGEKLEEHLYEGRHKLKFLTAGSVFRKMTSSVRGANKTHEMRIYAFDVEKIKDIPNPKLMNRDSIEDLLKYEPTESWHLSISAFHRLATERLSEGLHVYTKIEDGKLVHCGWLNERQEKSFIWEVDKDFTMPPHSAVLFDFFTHPQARGKGYYQSAMRQMLHDARTIPDTLQIYIAVAADNGPSRHAIEKVGFEYKSSLYR